MKGLDQIFTIKEKPPEEKRLEVITSKEAVLDDLRAYFEQNKYKGWKSFDACKEYFSKHIQFLKTFQLKPDMIRDFNEKKDNTNCKEAFGIYLSAIIQTNYDQGQNNFTFENINANCFGALLKGQPENPIKINAETIKGHWTLESAKNCSLQAGTIEGCWTLYSAGNCLAEIQNYEGRHFGGWIYPMKNCTIKSKNKETLEKIKKQVKYWENNKFELIGAND